MASRFFFGGSQEFTGCVRRSEGLGSLTLAGRMIAVAIDVRRFLHRFAFHAAILKLSDTRTDGVSALAALFGFHLVFSLVHISISLTERSGWIESG